MFRFVLSNDNMESICFCLDTGSELKGYLLISSAANLFFLAFGQASPGQS